MPDKPKGISIIGGGPAGLRAAEVAAEAGCRVHLFDAMPSVGRKFLIAGKSGLNLTNAQLFPAFIEEYRSHSFEPTHWQEILEHFDNQALRHWAASLGIETFVASSGKVFPRPMKAAPLLRRWISKLRALGVHFHMRHRWIDLTLESSGLNLHFQTPGGKHEHHADTCILALGGASWPKSGSNAQWVRILEKFDIELYPFEAANCGWETSWHPAVLDAAEGTPLKNIIASAGGKSLAGELMLTRYGLEGGPIYHLGNALRQQSQPSISIDLKPTFTHDELVRKMSTAKRQLLREAKIRWRLSAAALAILEHQKSWNSVEELATHTKNLTIELKAPRPIEEAISSAGGVPFAEVDRSLMLHKLPEVYLAGEMLDWEAPTGGYLLQACFATGSWAATAASKSK